MSYYTREDLKLKTYDKLYKIAINEKLINIFASDKTKSELIDLILLYRQDNTEKKILTLDYEGFFRLQELFDKKLRELPIEATDIQVPYSIKIFENADFSEDDNYYVLVSKNLHISTSICMITADNGYVYCILSLVEDTKYEDKVYRKYKINSEYVERLNFDCEYYKNPKMYFFENTMGDIIRDVYFNKRIDVIPEKIPCYSIKLFELKAEKLKEVKSPFPILFIDNKVYCKYFTKDFLMYIHKIQNDNFLIDYFENAKDRVLAKELNFYASCFQDMSTFFLDINSNIEVYDDYLQSKIVPKKQLVNQFIEYLIKKICAYSKCRYTKIYSIGLNIQDDRFVYIDLPFVLSYSKIKRLNKTYKSEKFLAIVSEFDNLNISENQFNIFEKDINYDITVNTNINTINYNLNFNTLIKEIIYLLKLKLLKINISICSINDLIKKIDSIGYRAVKDDLFKDYDDIEAKFSTDCFKYQNLVSEKYHEIKKNYYTLLNEAYDELNNYLNCKSTNLEKNMIEYVLCLELYNFLNNFFKKFTVIELLKRYKGVCLMGKIIKSELFYNLLKEFIPGKIIKYTDVNNDNYEYILELIYEYIEDEELAKIKLLNNITYDVRAYIIEATNFKDVYEVVLDTTKTDIGYIDKLDTVTKLDIKIKDSEMDIVYSLNLDLKKEFYERDELDTRLNQEFLDNIDNAIIRIFFISKEMKIFYKCATRYDDQVFVTDEYMLKFDTDLKS